MAEAACIVIFVVAASSINENRLPNHKDGTARAERC